MRLSGWRWLAVSSALLGALMHAETRPQYGGTLHVSTHAALTSLDPADSSIADSPARTTISSLVFDTLVRIDEAGQIRPGLAESWQVLKANQRWQFRLRHGVKFHDGTPLTGEIAAASLRLANPTWIVRVDGESVIIESEGSDPELLAELTLPRNVMVKRDAEKVSGTGPFHIVDWQPGKKLTLAAQEDCWRGRPFLDGIEVEIGRAFRDQATSLETGKSDLVEIAPEQSHRFSPGKGKLVSSEPLELLAVVFARDTSSPEEKALREALGLSVDRASIHSVLLQGAGQPAGSLLPTWISGYGFVFPSKADLGKARQLRDANHSIPVWTIGYDAGDPLARLVSERVALNARDAGLSVVPTGVGSTDMRLARIPLASADAWLALQDLAGRTGLPQPKNKGGAVEELFSAEQTALGTERVIPLFHLPAFYASSAKLKSWTVRADGSLDLAQAWLESVRQ